MTARISPSELMDQLPDILDRVRNHGERFVVERDGTVLAVIQPATATDDVGPTLHQLPSVLAGIPWPDSEYFDELEAIHAEMNLPIEPPEWPS